MNPIHLEKRTYNLSDVLDDSFSTQLRAEKKLKTITKTNSCSDKNPDKSITNKIYDSSLSQRSVKATKIKRKITKSKMQSDTEIFLFYRGLRTFGTNFENICINILPHRSIKEIKRFFKEQDMLNSFRIDQALQLYRTKSYDLNLKEVYFQENSVMLSTSNSSDGCSDCATLTQKYNINRPITKTLPSFDDCQAETAFQDREM